MGAPRPTFNYREISSGGPGFPAWADQLKKPGLGSKVFPAQLGNYKSFQNLFPESIFINQDTVNKEQITPPL